LREDYLFLSKGNKFPALANGGEKTQTGLKWRLFLMVISTLVAPVRRVAAKKRSFMKNETKK